MQPRDNDRVGFTLMELMAVLVILSVMAVGISAAFYGPITNLREKNFQEQFIHFQKECREECKQMSDVGVLVISPESLTWTIGSRARRLLLSYVCRIDSCRLRGDRKKFTGTRVSFDSQGISEDFAVHIITQRSRSFWLFVLGGTGDVLVLPDETTVRRIFHETQRVKETAWVNTD